MNATVSPAKYAPGRNWEAWPEYEAAASGLENFWYPVMWTY